jgi:FixJ family two-component response regulator
MAIETGRVYLVDDDDHICHSIAWVLKSVGYVVKTFTTAEQFLDEPIESVPYCLIVDLLLPGMTGLKLCRQVLSRDRACGFIVITGNADVPSAVEAMRMGAIDFLEKPFGRQRLLDSVDQTLQKVRLRYQNHLLQNEMLTRFATLTRRERDVFNKVAAGLPTKAIAASCGISTRTVDVHRSRILQKLGIESPTQLGHIISVLTRISEAGLNLATA